MPLAQMPAHGARRTLLSVERMSTGRLLHRLLPPRNDGLIADGALAAGAVAILLVGSYFTARYHPGARAFDPGALILLVAAGASLFFQRRHPVAVLGLVLALTETYLLLGYGGGPIWLALIVTYVHAIARGHRVAGGITAVLGVGVSPFLNHLALHSVLPSATFLATIGAWVLVLFAFGEGLRIRRQRAVDAARMREEEARRQASEERLRIARDLHDVLAHEISLINVQAGVALHLDEELSERARSALVAIRQASRDALGELRSVLDVLRRTGDPVPRRPAPGLAQLGELVSRARVGGLNVHMEVLGERRPLPAEVDVAAYRIVQEAVTNVIRHAGARHAWIRVTFVDESLELAVEDDGRGPSVADGRGDGNGIAGMRERAAALGGDLQVGSHPGEGFRVAARLPVGGSHS